MLRFMWLLVVFPFGYVQGFTDLDCQEQAEQIIIKAYASLDAEKWGEAAEGLKAYAAQECVKSNQYDYHEVLFMIAELEAKQERVEQAFAYLKKAVDEGFTGVQRFEEHEAFKRWKGEPAFNEIKAAIARNDRMLLVNYDSALDIPYREHLSDAEKVAGLSILWSEAKYNFAHFEKTDVKWDQLYLETIPKVIAAGTTAEYYETLARMCMKLKDGHTNIYLPKPLHQKYYGRPGFRTELVEGKVVVVEIYKKDLEDEKFKIGCELLTINGIPVHTYAERNVSPIHLMASTPQDLLSRRYDRGLLAGSVDQKLNLKLKTTRGDVFEKTFTHQMDRHKRPTLDFKQMGEMGYVAINSFSDSTLITAWQDLWPRLRDTKGLIIDLRMNGGGNTPTWLMKQVAKKPFKSNTFRTRMHVASQRAWGNGAVWYQGGGDSIEPAEEKNYHAPIVLLIGPRTFSAAEDFASTLKAMKRVTLFGEPTGGSTGQPLFFKLPGGGSGRVCSKRDTTFDGGEFVGVGVLPDVPVKQTVADIRNGKDAVLTQALAYLKKTP